MAMTSEPGLRIAVAGPGDLTFDITDDDVIVPPEDGDVEVRALPRHPADRRAGRRRFEVHVDGWVFAVSTESSRHARLRERAARSVEGAGATDVTTVRAQLPGRIVRVWVAPGDTVEPGQRLLAIEAMKMENEVRALRTGVVERVAVAAGLSVELGDELVIIR
jgi:acetyl-CoA/propionyl-CoA carboxylase biotin carboxyl carrier protein